ncbi:hypothetical protein [Sphingopyxis alaskensis]|jgi:hypothetical protein|uniref:Uncharacterized protein n=1 Tax=Sphingopyxis alaskensis (strain DSM 13593 / LMG 18877 / RB2256) TaxID=317655 RepID=Q1GQH3_SPHAL|nr:hypothetical protein [Sphingopyxis alaskensis]ABF54099.1 hypothetical protein Sala_2390 [Sphingopyxis alaskensis RB2256]MCM3418824.1 hypothetical protein [Sphingopyxis alaskensis]
MNGEATPEELEDIRDKIDSYRFRQNVRAALRGINDPEHIGQVQDALRKLQRRAESLGAKRTNPRDMFRIGGIGLSVGVFGSALVGAFSIAASPVLLVPMVGAAYIGWRSVSDSNHASREIEILRQIAEIAKELAKDGDRTK